MVFQKRTEEFESYVKTMKWQILTSKNVQILNQYYNSENQQNNK